MGVPAYLLSVFLLLAFLSPAAAKELVIDLSKSVVAITTGFVGSDLLLFGTVEGEGDVIVIVRGPQRDEIVRRKERVAGIWVNRDEVVFDQVPAFYAIASNRPIDEYLLPEVRDEYQIGAAHLEIIPRQAILTAGEVNEFRNALIRNKQRQGLYAPRLGNVIFLSNRLFRTQLSFPANVTTGTYGVDVYLVRNGQIAGVETTLLTVRKFGLEAGIYDFAHRHAMAYGVLAILVAGMAGWLAGVIFRKA